MTYLGSAKLNVVPKFPGLSSAVQKEFSKLDTSSPGSKAGADYGKGFGGGLAKSGAIIGAFALITNKAMDSIAGHLGSAIKRFDTLNNYPVVMQQLGYSAQDSESSISKMSDRLQNLPTTLDSMVSTVQGLSVITGDLNKATDAGLALNDMLIASGSGQQLVSSAMEQFRQILSKGKPDMMEWNSLVTAMPGQLDQLAKSMLGPTATANDLYAALGGGGKKATLSMDDLLQAMIKLDTQGGDGFASFKDQAETAAGGVQTSLENMSNAVTKGMTSVLDTVGKDNISGAFNDLKGAINEAFKVINAGVGAAMPAIKSFSGVVKNLGPAALGAVAAYGGFSKTLSLAGGALGSFNGIAKKSSESMLTLASKMKAGSKASEGLFKASGLLGGAMGGPVVLGITAAVTAAGFLVSNYMDAQKKSEAFTKATQGLTQAIDRTKNLDSYAGSISDVGQKSSFTAMSIDELNESIGKQVDKINETNQKSEEQIAQLSTAQSIIDQYIGVTDLSSKAQGELKWALKLVNDQFGLSITQADVMTGSYKNANGETKNLKGSVDQLVESKKKEIQLNALTEELTSAYKNESDAARTYAQSRSDYNKKLEETTQYLEKHTKMTHEQAAAEAVLIEASGKEKTSMDESLQILNDSTTHREDLTNELGDENKALSESKDAFDEWGNSVSAASKAMFEVNGTSLSAFKNSLRDLGVHEEDLNKITNENLPEIADAYDGTAASIIGKLSGIGVGMDDAKKNAAQMASDIKSSLEGMGDNVTKALSGVDLSAFSQKLAEAGVSTDQLNQIGSDNFAKLAQSCQGNTGLMVWAINNYNDTGIFDKDGRVRVDDVQLADAQGNVYIWNGSELKHQDGSATVDDVSVVDAQGHKLEWNNSKLEYTGADGVVHDVGMSDGVKVRDEWNRGGLKTWEGKGIIDIVKNITEIFTGGHASGGIRLNAEGGYRYHAAGAIAVKPVPLDIVGEAGAEAIVPLTNRRYSQPFVDLIADAVNQKSEHSGNSTSNYSFGDITFSIKDFEDIQTMEDMLTIMNRKWRAL